MEIPGYDCLPLFLPYNNTVSQKHRQSCVRELCVPALFQMFSIDVINEKGQRVATFKDVRMILGGQ